MEKYPKFIMEEGYLIIGKVTSHIELVKDKTKVKGGGWYKFDFGSKTFTFYESSHDFGKATLEDIKRAVADGKVCDTVKERPMRPIYNFAYDTGTEIIQLQKKND